MSIPPQWPLTADILMPVSSELEAARSTIAALQKRIGNLLASHKQQLKERRKEELRRLGKATARAEAAEQALTAERQRIEELEAERNAWKRRAKDEHDTVAALCDQDEALTAERQRREDAEAALREWENGYSEGWFYRHPDERPTARHFATYPSAEEKAGEG
jgi:seryl-tRNA synthetase